jgi:hypothetical protein
MTAFAVFMIIRKKWIPFWAFLTGGMINFVIDWGFWIHIIHIRDITLPASLLPGIPDTWRLFIFMLWFSIAYGFLFAWIFLMLDEKSNKVAWTLFLFGGWLSVAFLSQMLHIDDALITTCRHMGDGRFLQIGIAVAGYIALIILKVPWKKIGILYLMGVAVYFMMEFSLFISGIRPSSWLLLTVNSLLEFQMGMPILYILWDKWLKKFSPQDKLTKD